MNKIVTKKEILDVIKQQIDVLYDPDDIVEIRAICSANDNPTNAKPRSFWFIASDLVRGIEDFVNQNTDLITYPWSLYWGINPRKDFKLRGDKNVIVGRCLYDDFDLKDFQKTNPSMTLEDLENVIKQRVMNMQLPTPSIAGMSGGGYHVYWRLSEPITDLSVWTTYQKKLIKMLGSDESIHNPERVMRIIGTPNNKTRTPGDLDDKYPNYLKCGKMTQLIKCEKKPVRIEDFGFDRITLEEESKPKTSKQKSSPPPKQQIILGTDNKHTRLSPGELKLYHSRTGDVVIINEMDINADNKIICPFHADTDPSCSVDLVQKCFHCFGCGSSGKVFDYDDDQKYWNERDKRKGAEEKPFTDFVKPEIADQIKHFLTSPIDLKSVYEQSPKEIQELTQLFYTINPLLGAPLHYFISWVIVGGMIGKKIIGQSMGQIYYTNLAFCGMAQTGNNKSYLSTVDQILGNISYDVIDCPFALMNNNFTLPFIFSEIGETVGRNEWANMTEEEKLQKKKEIHEKNKLKRARIIISEELGHDLEKIGSSGQQGQNEKGAMLKMTDSGKEISRNTAKDGYRCVSDLCVTILGLSQKSTWQKFYDAYSELESGFTGRWLAIDGKDYRLNIDKLTISFNDAKSRIITILQGLAERFAKLPTMTVSFYESNQQDICSEAYSELMTENNYRRFDTLDNYFGLLRSKQITMAMRFCMIDRLLNLSDEQIKAIDKDKMKEYFNEKQTMGIEVNALKDKSTYKQYLKVFIENTIKVFSADAPKSEDDIIMDRIKNYLMKSPQNECTQKILGTQKWKYTMGYNHKYLTSKDAEPILDRMEEMGLIHRTYGQHGSVTIKLAQKSLQV